MGRIYLLSTWILLAAVLAGHAQETPVRFGIPQSWEMESPPASRVPTQAPPPPPAIEAVAPVASSSVAPAADMPPPIVSVATQPAPAYSVYPRTAFPAARRRVISGWSTASETPTPKMLPLRKGTVEPPATWDASGIEMGTSMPRVNALWFGADYGMWWMRGSSLPPLVTRSPVGTPLANAGVLGAPGTTVVIGNEDVNDGMIWGGTLRAGIWLDEYRTWAIQGDFLYLAPENTMQSAGSNGTDIVARPFFDAASGASAAQLVSFPGLLAGTTSVASDRDPLLGAGVLLRRVISRLGSGDPCDDIAAMVDLSLLAGYRYLRLQEDLTIQEDLLALDPLALGTNLIVTDRFGTRNQFHGGDVGVHADYWRDRFSLGATGRIAFGSTYRRVAISGSTEVTAPGFPTLVNDGGLYALSSNSGVYDSTVFAIVPQVDVTAGYQVTRGLRATVGYSALWWTHVARPGDQIDPVVNPNLLPPVIPGGPARPAFILHDSTFWVHGVRFGLEFRF